MKTLKATSNKEGYEITLDLNNFENTSDAVKLLDKVRIDLLLNNANSINDVIEGAGFEFKFEGVQEVLKVEDAPENMTVKDLKAHNEIVDKKVEIVSQVKEELSSVPILDKDEFNILFRRLYPILTYQDLDNIHDTANELGFCYSQKINNIEYIIDLVIATKEQTGL